MTDVAVREGSDLAITADQGFWTQKQIAVLRQLGLEEASNADLAVFFHQCVRTGLDPFARQLYLIGRWSREGTKYTIQTGIDGYRLVARRAVDRAHETLEYEETLYCGKDGRWTDVWLADEPPAAAKVVVLRGGQRFPAVALWKEYVQLGRNNEPNSMWARMGSNQLAKCFTPDTEVLTDRGFRRFPNVGEARIMQVTDGGLEPVRAVPFRQDYDGPMVTVEGDTLNFAVTPNHDMVTTVGKVEAGALLATSQSRPVWRIPLTAPVRLGSPEWSDDDLRLAGYVLADGWHNGHRLWNVAVSRPYKVAALRALAPMGERVVASRGSVATAREREVRSNFDKALFTFPVDRIASLLDTEKAPRFDVLAALSGHEARVLLDAWQEFDGHTSRKTGVRRIYTSREEHVAAIELLAVLAGYTVSAPSKRTSDLSERPGYSLTLSEAGPAPVVLRTERRPGIGLSDNPSGEVWCVTVPSHTIVVRRNGFSMVCGQCAEALALRKAFPQDLSGIYTDEEMGQADSRAEAERDQRAVRQQIAERDTHRAVPAGGRAIEGQVAQAPEAPKAPPTPQAVATLLIAVETIPALEKMIARLDELGMIDTDVEVSGDMLTLGELAQGQRERIEAAGTVEEPKPEEPKAEEPTVEAIVTAAEPVAKPAATPAHVPSATPDPEDQCKPGPARTGVIASLGDMGVSEADLATYFGRPVEQVATRKLTQRVKDVIAERRAAS